uniref:NADH-ubiquinone oxidoreductase chain 1 n=1 Tax=Haliclystus antarcticus TaxID=654955 RepID=A0A173FZN4_HALAN|nr:NADH dehydrogenase subunit 1 [Haliclystus antarcticus]ANH09490.1 NADH dehydrogenase subunit 1 [Haliclystus antarcticus]
MVIKGLIILIPLLISVAYLTLAERKVLGYMQSRKGPNIVGIYGLLQPLADGVKLFGKEFVWPTQANRTIYILAPIVALFLAFTVWAVLSFDGFTGLADIPLGLLLILALSSIGVYTTLMSGWASTSRYAFLGALRAAAQMISYEVAIGLLVLTVIAVTSSFHLGVIIDHQYQSGWFWLPLLPAALMFYVSGLAETNRAPFDLTEGESELVSGYNVEYASMPFALFFLGEYGHILFMSTLISVLFLGGWTSPFPLLTPSSLWLGLKVGLVSFSMLWVRASYPRIRYDQLMALLWKSYLPLSLACVITYPCLLVAWQGI